VFDNGDKFDSDVTRRGFPVGYEVSATIANGESALRYIVNDPPDLVLMDITIEGPIDGIEVAARIPSVPLVPVIFMTAHADDETLARVKATHPFG
jgi:CheY-like chemotaxis protein